jgi:hypothetical protein
MPCSEGYKHGCSPVQPPCLPSHIMCWHPNLPHYPACPYALPARLISAHLQTTLAHGLPRPVPQIQLQRSLSQHISGKGQTGCGEHGSGTTVAAIALPPLAVNPQCGANTSRHR